jgi:pyruvate kinase
MLDTQGPEIRLGSFAGGEKEVELKQGNIVTLTTDAAFRNQQSKEKLWVSYEKLTISAAPGSLILLDDGAIELVVKEVGIDRKIGLIERLDHHSFLCYRSKDRSWSASSTTAEP